MAIDERLKISHDLNLLAAERRLFVDHQFTRAERAQWVIEVVHALEVALPVLPSSADGIAAKARWLIQAYRQHEQRPLTAAQRLTWAEQAVRTLVAAHTVLEEVATKPDHFLDFYREYNEELARGERLISKKGRLRPEHVPTLTPPAEHEKGDPRSGWRPGRKNVPRDG